MLEFVVLPFFILEFIIFPLLLMIGVAAFMGFFEGDFLLPWKDETGNGNDWSTCLGLLVMMGFCIGFLIYLNS